MDFFDPEKRSSFAEILGRTDRGTLTGQDFRHYLVENADFFQWFHPVLVYPVLRDMVRANLLYDNGLARTTDGVLGHAYEAFAGAITNSQRAGDLWQSQMHGPALIIASYGPVTIHFTGKTSKGDIANGSGVVLDQGHILTNAHVVNDCTIHDAIPAPKGKPPGIEWPESGPEMRLPVSEALVHEEIDVAVVPWSTSDGAPVLNALAGIAFRDPFWSDEVYTFGYPPVSTLDGPYLVVQRGEVVNPSVTSPRERGGLPLFGHRASRQQRWADRGARWSHRRLGRRRTARRQTTGVAVLPRYTCGTDTKSTKLLCRQICQEGKGKTAPRTVVVDAASIAVRSSRGDERVGVDALSV